MSISLLLFPENCPLCNSALVKGEESICLSCLSDLPYSYFWSWRENPAEELLQETIEVERVASLFLYREESNWKRAIHKFKYGCDLKLGLFLASILATKLLESGWRDYIDIVIPVPLHPLKKWRRGYNQSAIIASKIADILNLPMVESFLKRRKYGVTQTHKNRERRQKGVKKAFVLTKKGIEGLEGKRVLLVDDVLTTGATIEGCFNALLKGAPNSVLVATLAFVE